jgi:uncharacterized protein YutD
MVIKNQKGFFEVLKNVKDCYQIEKFEERYIEEIFDQYPYIVGDISDEKLRLKGFNTDPMSRLYFKKISEYILESCSYQTPYFILKRINQDEYERRKNEEANEKIFTFEEKSFVLEKENYDKDSLTLKQSDKSRPNIRLNISRLTEIKPLKLPRDLEEEVTKARQAELGQTKNKKQRPRRDKKDQRKDNTSKVFTHVNSNK